MTRLAFALADRLKIWTEEDYDAAKVMWTTLAEDLSGASYGSEMIHLIGKVYHLSALQFLGSTDSGVGMPSIAKWAKVRNLHNIFPAASTLVDDSSASISCP